jgi:hypothetical protein
MNVFRLCGRWAGKALLSSWGLNLSIKGSGETTIPFNSVRLEKIIGTEVVGMTWYYCAALWVGVDPDVDLEVDLE